MKANQEGITVSVRTDFGCVGPLTARNFFCFFKEWKQPGEQLPNTCKHSALCGGCHKCYLLKAKIRSLKLDQSLCCFLIYFTKLSLLCNIADLEKIHSLSGANFID